MATLRLHLERWFSDITESYFLRATVEAVGSVPVDIIDSLKVQRADLDTREPEQLIGFCNRVEMEYFLIGGDISYLSIPDYEGSWSTLVGTDVEIEAADIPLPWQELGITTTITRTILSRSSDLRTIELDGVFPCGVKPIRYTLVTPAFTGLDGLPVLERYLYPEIEHVRLSTYVAPYDDLAGVVDMVETLKTGAQALVDEWNEYETEYEGLDLEVFE